MEESVKPRRPYRSERRREQALETRSRILEAARGAFVEHGYGGATIAGIAARAGVSPETVYAAFRNKRTVIREALADAARGGDPTPLVEQPGPRAVAAEPDPHEKLRLFAADISERLARTAPLVVVLGAAALAEPELEATLEEMHSTRRRNLRLVAEALEATGRLRPSVDEATETIWALASHELYTYVVDGGGWAPERYERWLAESLDALLLVH